MAKRFTDTDKWKKPFIRTLEAPYKLLWLYILDDCDHAGMWQVDIEVAEIRIGEKLLLKKAQELFFEKIKIFDNGEKWFIQDFIDFQYGKLNPENRAHKSVLNLLDKYENKGLTSSLEGAKDKDKDKDKVKEKEKEKDIQQRKIDFYQEIGESFSGTFDKSMLLKFCDYWTEHNEGGKKMRFEMERVFDKLKRINTWKSNQSKFSNNGKQGVTEEGRDEARARANANRA